MIRLFKRLFIAFLAIAAPWIIMLMNDDPVAAVGALILQATLVGWPFATIWAWRTQYPGKKKNNSH